MARTTASRGLVTTIKLPDAKVGIFHGHGCTTCAKRYTDSCDTPKTNGLCPVCSRGTVRAKWDRDTDPIACCRTASVLVTDGADITKYSLGGDGAWFKCRTCSRTHPYDPTTRN